MRHITNKVGQAVIARVYEFDIFDAVDAKHAMDELNKAMFDAVYVDDEGTPHEGSICIDKKFADNIFILLSKIASPILDNTKHKGLFETESDNVVTEKGAK